MSLKVSGGFGILLALATQIALAQCPSADFQVQGSACLEETLFPINNSTAASTYSWDFCSGDLTLSPNINAIASSAYLLRSRSFKIVGWNGKWTGFAIDHDNDKLLRFDFGNNPSNSPFLTNLGNPGNVLSGAYDFCIYIENNHWYILVANTGANTLAQFDFGTDLESVPSAVDRGSFSTLQSPNGIYVTTEGSVKAWITNGSAPEIDILEFGNSIVNAPMASSIAVPGANTLRGISFTKECNQSLALITSYNSNSVYYLDFIDGLDQPPDVGSLVGNPSFPASVSILQDGGDYFAFIQSALGNLYRINFGTSIIDHSGTLDDLGNFGIADNFATAWIKKESMWYGFSVNNLNDGAGNGALMRIDFPSPCYAVPAVSADASPTVYYTAAGTFKVTLSATDDFGSVTTISKDIIIGSTIAPDISFLHDFECVNHAIDFSSQNISGDLISYDWDFGDAGNSAQQNPSHIYALIGSFPVSLDVTNGTCANHARDTLFVYEEPAAGFNLPDITPLCTNQPYPFINTSTYDPSSDISWQWKVNGVNAASTQDLIHAFSSTTSTDITLVASIPGCSDQHLETVPAFLTGPAVNFTFSGQCQNAPVSFTNETVGTVMGYSWDFDDGPGSSQTDPSHTYGTDGTYTVRLTATSSNGCENFDAKDITVYSEPQPDFSIALPPFSCNGSPTQFNDATPNPTDSNIAGWQWNFGDTGSGNTSTQQNPQHTYADAADYAVTLQTTTNFGCSGTIQKSISISPSPAVDFANPPACINQPTVFSDDSDPDVTDWSWQIGSAFYSVKNPSHTFAASGNYDVILSVTGANGCIAQTIKQVNVPTLPVLDFDFTGNCAGFDATFKDLTLSPTDPVEKSSWTFEGIHSVGNPVVHSFSTTGSYPVLLTVNMESGCTYTFQESVPVGSGPVAGFTIPFDVGTPPFDVSFTNTSTQATIYQWQFGDDNNSTSTKVSPDFTFNKTGNFTVSLTATNPAGCADTVKHLISVVKPKNDIALSDMHLFAPADFPLNASVTVTNKGNLPVSGLPIYLDLSAASVLEKIDNVLLPGDSLEYTFRAQIAPSSGLAYVCARVPGDNDITPADNTACVALNSSYAFHAHPNPAGESLVVDWIGVEARQVRIRLMDPAGRLLIDSEVAGRVGYNQFVIQTAPYVSGLYLLEWRMGDIRKISRIFVKH